MIDELKKENFSLKLKIYYLEEHLAKISPENVDQALQEVPYHPLFFSFILMLDVVFPIYLFSLKNATDPRSHLSRLLTEH